MPDLDREGEVRLRNAKLRPPKRRRSSPARCGGAARKGGGAAGKGNRHEEDHDRPRDPHRGTRQDHIYLDDEGRVADTQFHVTQVRGFEKFTEGRPFYEMPSITARICGICPVSHLLASSKACDAIMAVRIPEAGGKLRELLHCAPVRAVARAQLLPPLGARPAAGLRFRPGAPQHVRADRGAPRAGARGIALRKFGQQIIEGLAKERIHPSWTVPGGVNAPLTPEVRGRILAEMPKARAIADSALDFFKGVLDSFPKRSPTSAPRPRCTPGWWTEGRPAMVRRPPAVQGRRGPDRGPNIKANDYATYIGEASLRDSYLKAPYFKPLGYPEGVYRVGPLARLNVADACGTPAADASSPNTASAAATRPTAPSTTTTRG